MEKIDFVISWVDSDDLEWQKKKSRRTLVKKLQTVAMGQNVFVIMGR